jgi:DNA-binding FadR family transcriptional regulator
VSVSTVVAPEPRGRARSTRADRTGLHRDVVHRLGLAIVRGDHAPGAALPRADALASELGVSRTVIREAMKVLADKGLVEARKRSGTRVRPPDDWNLLDPDVIAWRREAGPDLRFLRYLTEVRMTLEPSASRLAAERASPDDLLHIGDLFRQMEVSFGDEEAYNHADMEFHRAIMRATHNPLLALLAETIREGLKASHDVTRHRPGGTAYALPLHGRVATAITARDPARAERAMRLLIRHSIDDIEAVLRVRQAT